MCVCVCVCVCTCSDTAVVSASTALSVSSILSLICANCDASSSSLPASTLPATELDNWREEGEGRDRGREGGTKEGEGGEGELKH